MNLENGIDRNTCKELREQLDVLLFNWTTNKAIGLEYRIGNMSYDSAAVKVQLEFSVEELKSEQDNGWLKMSGANFVVGDSYEWGGKTYTVSGYKSKARKNKVLLQCGGKEYSSSIENVNKMMVWSKKVNESHIGIGVIDSDTGNRVIE